MAYRRSFLRAFVSLALLFLEQSALAAEATAAPDAPRPLVIDIKSASAVLRSERRVPVSTLGVTLSIPLGRPWLRGGLSYSVAASGTPVSPRTTVRGSYALSGNLSAWTRAVWQSNGLYAAGFLEMWFPTAAFDPAGPAGAAADAAQSTVLAEPWRFTPGALGGSLGVEVGFQRGPFISAVHQTLDAAFIVVGAGRQSGIATTVLLLDFELAKNARLGGRLLQRYDLDPSVSAVSRRRLQIGPSVIVGQGRTVFETMVLFGDSAAHPATLSTVLRLSLRHTW